MKLVIKNINNAIITSNENNKSEKSIKNYVVWAFNKIINWTGYESYFEYYVIFPLANDVPKEVQRDYALLTKESEWLTNYLKVVAKKWINIKIETACNGIDEVECNLEWDIIDIVWKIAKNQTQIIDIYRRAVMWKLNENEKIDDLILVDNSENKFIKEIIKNYWLGNNCLKTKESFFVSIWNKIKEIWQLNELWQKWMKEWKEAFDLLIWNKPTENIEKELLKQELARQWISWDRAQAVMKNLEEFNQNWWYTKDNNFITNTFEHLWDVIEYEKNKFNTNVIEEFGKLSWEQNTKTITSLLDESGKVKINLYIAESVSKIYKHELHFVALSIKTSNLSRVDIINLHSELNKWILILSDLKKVSERVCNKQSTWEWICTTY